MRCISMTIGLAAVALWLSACAHVQTSENNGQTQIQPSSFSDNGLAAQKRISRSLQSTVMTPTMRECWSRLRGEGAIAMDFSYKKSGNNWALETVGVTKSTLPKEQETAAVKCMQDAARNSSFPVDRRERLETAAENFLVRLSVSVPLPPPGAGITSSQMARINGSGGLGDVAGCSTCVSRTEFPYGVKCEARSTGGESDCREHSPNVCSTAPTACLRGFFSGTSGVIMY